MSQETPQLRWIYFVCEFVFWGGVQLVALVTLVLLFHHHIQSSPSILGTHFLWSCCGRIQMCRMDGLNFPEHNWIPFPSISWTLHTHVDMGTRSPARLHSCTILNLASPWLCGSVAFLQNACNIGINLACVAFQRIIQCYIFNKCRSSKWTVQAKYKKCDSSTIGIRSRLKGCNPKVDFICSRMWPIFRRLILASSTTPSSVRLVRIKSLLDSIKHLVPRLPMWKAFEDVASGGGTARCNMQSNNEVFKKASCESLEVSSVHGESHPAKRGSPGKWDPTMLYSCSLGSFCLGLRFYDDDNWLSPRCCARW